MAIKTAERMEFLADVVISAVEGGTGYWACVTAYEHEEAAGTFAVLHELDEDQQDYKAEALRIDTDTIAKGLRRILGNANFKINSDLCATIRDADAQNDAGLIDAEGADVIVQAALFGEIVYG